MRIALVHDDFTQSGGAESLFATIAALYPNAPIYTSLVNWDKLPQSIEKDRIHTSFMQKIPFAARLYKLLLPLYPLAFESFDFSQYDLVISSATRFAKAIITKPGTTHICYINSIPRFLHEKEKKLDYLHWSIIALIAPYLKWLKRWDQVCSNRVDLYIANSNNVQMKINKFYGRESKVVYPFADTDFYKPSSEYQARSYYLVVTRLVKWKKVEISIRALPDQENLIIAGTGPDKNRLVTIARGKNVEFREAVDKQGLKKLYQGAIALIVTQEEDFGIAAVEAQACGTPVIGFFKGGSAEIVISPETGVLFDKQDADSLKDAIIISSGLKYKSSRIRKNALRFTKKNFENNFRETVNKYVNSA